jgi:integrase/recombinase XerD
MDFLGIKKYFKVSEGRYYVTFFVTSKLAVIMRNINLHLHLRKDKKGDSNTFPLFIRLSSKGLSVYHSLKLKLKPNEWDIKKAEIRASSVHSYFNKDLLIIKSRFVTLLNELSPNVEFNKDDLKLFLGVLINGSPQTEKVVKQGEPTLGELMKEFYDSSLDKKVNTLACYRVLINKLSNFQNSLDLPISKIDLPWLIAFESHLANNLHNKINTIWREMKNLKACFNYAREEERIDPKTYPFKRYQLKTEKVMKESLSTEELRRLELYNPLSKLEQLSKDLFIFSAYGGGLRHSDCFTLKMKHIHEKRYILKEQVKTKGAVAIPIHPKAAEIL